MGLVLPLVVWLASYLVLVFHFVPRLQKVSMAQSDARAQMTGRIVDSYTNIQTIKLFAHTMREQDYARGAMDEFMVTVHAQMRLVTQLTVALHTLNAFLLASVAGVAIWAWLQAWVLFALYILATTVLFGSVPWSKFAHMFFKPAAAFEKRVSYADGTRSNLPAPVDKPEQFGSARTAPIR